jgi:hypothetical protein
MLALLPVVEVAALTGAAVRTVRLHAATGRYSAERMPGMGGSEYRISLDSLPADAQARYWRERIKAPTPAEQRARLAALNLDEEIARQVAREAGIHRREERIEPLPLTPAEWRTQRERWEQLPSSMRAESERRAKALQRLDVLLKDGRSKMAAFEAAAAEFGESTATLRRWLAKVKNQHRADWYLLLAPGYTCEGAPEAEIHPDAWAYIQAEWLVDSGITLTSVCRRAQREAKRRGWGVLPSIKTIKRRIDKELDHRMVVLMREGEDALDRLYPAQQRDYSTLGVHDLWVSDGRKADLFVVFPDGEIGRPILMLWMDVRTRKPLGWAVGKTENTPLVRASLRDAMTRAKAIPREFLLDNGRAYASKEITGGQTTRYRFKINDDDMLGVATLLNIKVVWATPGHGQAKPIESFWRTLSETDRRAEFAGAYCGNDPLDKPEGFDPKKAVPLAQYLAAVREDLDAYLERGHRGDSMDMQSPSALYDELMATSVVRTPTAEQIRLCLQAAENKMLDADHGVTLFGGNRYWCETLAKLPSRGPYTVRYDADDATAPVAVYDGDRFLCEAPIYLKAGFRDQEAAKAHIRARTAQRKHVKGLARALKEQADAARWVEGGSPTPVAPQAGDAPAAAAAVPQLVATRRKGSRPAPQPSDDGAVTAKLGAALRAIRAREDEDNDGWDRRAAGAR